MRRLVSPLKGEPVTTLSIFRSHLQKCLREWTREGGDLGARLYAEGELVVSAVREAQSVCDALEHAAAMRPSERETKAMVSTPIHALTGLFQCVQTHAASRVLAAKGLPVLNDVVQQHLYAGQYLPTKDLLFILKVMAAYHFQPGVRHVAHVLRNGDVVGDHYLWPVIFAQYAEEGHPHALSLIKKLSQSPLPKDAPGIGLLHLANTLADRRALLVGEHPFDNPVGARRLGSWLKAGDGEDEHVFRLRSLEVVKGLRYVSRSVRESVLPLAATHPHPAVRLEASGVELAQAAPGGRETSECRAALERLIHAAETPAQSAQASRILRGIGKDFLLPKVLGTRDFQAQVHLCETLKRTASFGSPPDRVEVVASRKLLWPPGEVEDDCVLCRFVYDGPRPDHAGATPLKGEGVRGMALIHRDVVVCLDPDLERLNADDLYAFFSGYEVEQDRARRSVLEWIERGRTRMERHRATLALAAS